MKRSVEGFKLAVPAAAVLLVIAALFALAGCGGSDSSAATANSPTTGGGAADPVITKAELIKKGDAICRRTDRIQKEDVATYSKKHPNELIATADQEKLLTKVALPPIGTEIEELAALGVPKGDEAKVTAIVSGLEKALKAAERKPSTLLGLGEGGFTEPDKLAGAYGFKDCAKAL